MTLKMKEWVMSHEMQAASTSWDNKTKNSEKTDAPVKPSEGTQPCQHLDFKLQTPRTMRIYLCCFKLIHLW